MDIKQTQLHQARYIKIIGYYLCLVGREASVRFYILHQRAEIVTLQKGKKVCVNIYIYIYIYLYLCTYICIYIYRKSASRFSRGTVLNTLKQSRINIMRGDATTYPDKPVSWIASLFRGLMKEYSCDYRLYTRKIYIIRG